VFESGTSKGSFYHYFSGKDALLSSLSYLFDEKYEELTDSFTPDMTAADKLTFLNHELFRLIEDSISMELLARLLSTQLVTKSEKHLLDHDRTYYRLLRAIFSEGRQSGEFGTAFSVNEMVKTFALWERAVLYDWCLVGGEYPLAEYGRRTLPLFLAGFRACEET
jgi:AcrR family transcriptional regulator